MFDDQETLETVFAQVSEKVFQDYGIDLLEVRDLHTGAPIGQFMPEIFHLALHDEGLLDDSEDGEVLEVEALADALLVRNLASARPSPALNRPTTQSIRRLLQSHPTQVCAYLLNRYHLTDWRKLNHRSESWFDDMLSRVRVWEQLCSLTRFSEDADASERTLRALAHWLLELDSKCNLHTLTPNLGWFDQFHALLNIEEFEAFVTKFESIAIPLIVEADKAFSIGNRMTSSAYVQSWFDNPTLVQRKVEIANKKAQGLYDKYGSVKAGLIAEANKPKKAQDNRIIKGRSSRSKAAQLVNKHADRLNALFRTLSEVSDAPSPAPAPIKRTTGLPKFVKG